MPVQKIAGQKVKGSEIAKIVGGTDGTARANKAVIADANKDVTAVRNLTLTGNLNRSIATPAAAGTNQATATAMTADVNDVTGADGTKGVALPAAVAGMEIVVLNNGTSNLKVYPVNSGSAAINGLSANAALIMLPGETLRFCAESTTQWRTVGHRLARGVAAVTGTATVVTGLNTVVAVIATAQDDPDGTSLAMVSATVGDQAGSPAAGSITIKAWKVTATGNATLIAATAAKSINWVAVGS